MACILVIDDDPAVRRTLRRILELHDHEVLEAEDGEEGMAVFHAGGIELVVTDLVMPEKEGIETILEIRAQSPDLPILAVSGGISVSKTGPLLDAAALGANATLEKPFSATEFMDAVNELLGTA